MLKLLSLLTFIVLLSTSSTTKILEPEAQLQQESVKSHGYYPRRRCPCRCSFGDRAQRQCYKRKYRHCIISNCLGYRRYKPFHGWKCCDSHVVTTHPPTTTTTTTTKAPPKCPCYCTESFHAWNQCKAQPWCGVSICHSTDHRYGVKAQCCDKVHPHH